MPMLEELTFLSFHREAITPGKETMQELLDKHHLRKHGKMPTMGRAEHHEDQRCEITHSKRNG